MTVRNNKDRAQTLTNPFQPDRVCARGVAADNQNITARIVRLVITVQQAYHDTHPAENAHPAETQ